MFIHFDLPRAAGNSFMDCIERIHGQERVLHVGPGLRFDTTFERIAGLSPAQLGELKQRHDCFVVKHPVPLHRVLGLPYVGFVREPAEWYASSYFWARKQATLGSPANFYGYNIAKYNLSLDSFVRWLHDIGHDNIQSRHVRRLGGAGSDPVDMNARAEPFGETDHAAARRFLDDSFIVWAPTSLLGRALFALGVVFDWPWLPLWTLPNSTGWQKTTAIPDSLRDFIARNSRYDCRLHADAAAAFAARFQMLFDRFGDDADDYEACSRRFNDGTFQPLDLAEIPDDVRVETKRVALRNIAPVPPSDTTDRRATADMDCRGRIHSRTQGHVIVPLPDDAGTFAAVPEQYLFDPQADRFSRRDAGRPGVLTGSDPADLRARIDRGEAPTLVDIYLDIAVWLYRGRHRLVPWRETDTARVFDDPEAALASALTLESGEEAKQVFGLLTVPHQQQRIDGYQVSHSGETWRAAPEKPGDPAFQARSFLGLLAALHGARRLAVRPPPVPVEIDSLAGFNVVRYRGLYHGLRQGHGTLEELLGLPEGDGRRFSSPHLIDIRRRIVEHWRRGLASQPAVVETAGATDIVAIRGRYFAVRHRPGTADPDLHAIQRRKDIPMSRSLARIRALSEQKRGWKLALRSLFRKVDSQPV